MKTREEARLYQISYRKTEAGKKARRKEQHKFYYEKYKDKYKEYKQFLYNLRMEKGGKCKLCGFEKEPKILHFHHIKEKLFEVCKYRGIIRPKIEERIRAEADKCILVCPNCHALIHLKERQEKYGYDTN